MERPAMLYQDERKMLPLLMGSQMERPAMLDQDERKMLPLPMGRMKSIY